MWLEERAGLALTGDSYLEGLSFRGLDDFNGLEARGLALMGDELRQGLQQHGEMLQREQHLFEGLQQQGAIQQVEHE